MSFSDDGAFALTAAAQQPWRLADAAGNGEVQLWDSATALPIGPPARHEGSRHQRPVSPTIAGVS